MINDTAAVWLDWALALRLSVILRPYGRKIRPPNCYFPSATLTLNLNLTLTLTLTFTITPTLTLNLILALSS